jgi:hypothetical protein
MPTFWGPAKQSLCYIAFLSAIATAVWRHYQPVDHVQEVGCLFEVFFCVLSCFSKSYIHMIFFVRCTRWNATSMIIAKSMRLLSERPTNGALDLLLAAHIHFARRYYHVRVASGVCRICPRQETKLNF